MKSQLIIKLENLKNLKTLVEEELYSAKDICNFLELPEEKNTIRNINSYLRRYKIKSPYPKITDRNSRIIEKYKSKVPEWWNHPKLKTVIEFKLKNNLVINYADKDKKIARYVISVKYHPRASSANQVKAHIILWELHNKQLFPDNYVMIPKDGNFLNLNIDNFDVMSNEEYRSITATGKRNHFYTTGSKSGVCYKGGWKTISKKFLQTNTSCEICGCSNKYKLNVHHIISYYLFDKSKDAHFLENLICLCDSCHQNLHLGKLNLLGILSEKIRLKLLKLLETLKEKFKNDDKLLLVNFSIKSISSQADLKSEGSTTISKESTSQANGDGNRKHLNSNEKDDDIV